MGKNRGKLSSICIYIGSILILALKSEISGSLVGLSAFHPQHAFVSPAVSRFSGPPTPQRRRQQDGVVDAISDHLLKSRLFSDFCHSESSEGWWLKVDGTPFTWYFRITKITKLLSGGLVKIQNSCGRHSRPLRRDRGKSFAMTITFWSTVAVALWHRIYRSSMRTKSAVSSSKI